MKIKKCFSLLIFAGLFLFCSVGGLAFGAKGILRHSADVPARSWNPHHEQAAMQMTYLGPVYESLIGEDDHGKFIPQLATKWEWGSNSVTFTLRENVLFHDGTKFNAEAVKINIENVKKRGNPANSAALKAIESVDVVDETHVRFRLSGPAPNLLYNLQRFPGLIVSPEALKSDILIKRPVGTGPWKLDPDISIKDTKYVYVLNDKYYDPSVQGLEGIVIYRIDFEQGWNAFRTGELDIATLYYPFLAQAKAAGYLLVSVMGPHQALIIADRTGKTIPELADARVRRAISHALDRDAYFRVTRNGAGIPCTQRFLSDSPWHAKNIENIGYNLEYAKKLMNDAGVKNFSFDVFSQSKGFDDENEAIAGMLKKIGITMNIKKIPVGTLWAEGASGKWPISVLPTFERHPLDYYHSRLTRDGNLNPFKHEDKEIDALAHKALTALDEKAGNPIWADILRLEAERGYHIHLGVTEYPIVVNQKKVKNVRGYLLTPGAVNFRGVTME